MQAVIRIDEVERQGEGKIKRNQTSDKIANFPNQLLDKPKKINTLGWHEYPL